MENKSPAPDTPPNTDAGSTQPLDSPLKPLLWVLIPFVIIMVYGALSG